ncbi:MAG: SAM-dependent methyltransferase [Dehalococcoidia bacterium]|nr:MAG: SAM-dependent methyltransferase [Dehalococcoidia bacterium]
MKEGKPSFTAEGTVAFRFAEWLAPEDERMCHDPLAKDFVATKFRIIGKSRLLTKIALWCAERLVPGMVSYIVGRTKYIDAYLKARIDDGIEQLVILGAGYDSRAYRFDELKGKAKVFEVDFPATQKVKMEKVKRIFGSLPDNVVYVPVDFDEKKLGDGLCESGYDKKLKTLFIWEGVTPYITAEAMDETLAFVAKNSGEGSSIIFDYVFKSALDGTYEREQVQRIRKLWERIGQPVTSERFCFGIEEGAIEEFLSQRGFYQVENVTAEFFESAHFKGPHETLKVWCVVYATVKPQK